MTNLEKFMAEYRKQLAIAVEKYPGEYGYGANYVESVADKMKIAFERGSYNKDSRAIKATCKIFGIKHTYKELNAFLKATPIHP